MTDHNETKDYERHTTKAEFLSRTKNDPKAQEWANLFTDEEFEGAMKVARQLMENSYFEVVLPKPEMRFAYKEEN